jgi:hypothetical protein
MLPSSTAAAEGLMAPPSLTPQQMSALMHTYVEGEAQAAIPFAGTGALTLAASGLLLQSGKPLDRGAAWPLLSVGAIEVIAGVALGARAHSHEAGLDRLLAENPQEFARRERHHLHLIRDRYQPALLAVEGVLAVGGGTMAALSASRRNESLEGVGLGLGIQGLALFLLDWAVLDRARPYATGLAQFLPEPAGG